MNILYETDRLIIRKWEDEDYLDLYEYASDKEVTKYLTFKTYESVENAKERIKFMKECYENGIEKTDYAIMLKIEGKVIGSIGLGLSHIQRAGGTISIGYLMNKKYHGKGFMTEAVRGMFKYIKENNIAKRIEAFHDVENYRSGNVMKRAGMTFEGVLRKAHSNNIHERCDTAIYSILIEEIN